MIELTTTAGYQVAINPVLLESVHAHPDNTTLTVVRMGAGKEWYIKGNYSEVKQALDPRKAA
jgi:uncharacterized protein YlzI (FlbEa/FlbD family)